ncbi:SRPBCC family protein [Aureitalea marina]|uniref:SRPBCC family protein n=1 Tax=Aureitalea marina TaxID=930804 RepID=A0A2S7KMT8_9FLAO|nr:SRPBCC family protein [Aureitalea marina]PQB03946.1 hypothetical protein BST85_02760 [Aureitalea marina]
MKYRNEITIDLPRSTLIEKLDNPDNMKHWQRGLIGYKLLNEEDPGAVGAQMELEYKMGKRQMIMTETITKRDFPGEFHATYDAKGVHNIQQNFFEEVDAQSTKWVSESEFQFASFGMKLMGWLMPGAFKKQSLKYMMDFKNFAEKGVSVADG